MIISTINKDTWVAVREWAKNPSPDIIIDSPGGDFFYALEIVRELKKVNPRVILYYRGISAGAFIFLSLPNRLVVSGSYLYLHNIEVNTVKLTPTIIRTKRKYHLVLLRTIREAFKIDTSIAEGWLKTGMAFYDTQVADMLQCEYKDKILIDNWLNSIPPI